MEFVVTVFGSERVAAAGLSEAFRADNVVDAAPEAAAEGA